MSSCRSALLLEFAQILITWFLYPSPVFWIFAYDVLSIWCFFHSYLVIYIYLVILTMAVNRLIVFYFLRRMSISIYESTAVLLMTSRDKLRNLERSTLIGIFIYHPFYQFLFIIYSVIHNSHNNCWLQKNFTIIFLFISPYIY